MIGIDSRSYRTRIIRGLARFRHGHTDQAIPGYNLGQLVFTPSLGALGSYRQYDETGFLVRVLYPYLNVIRKLQPELRKYLTRPTHQTASVVGRAIPFRGLSEDRSWIT
jgi:hypothetical protein